jgi:hypothetical protein
VFKQIILRKEVIYVKRKIFVPLLLVFLFASLWITPVSAADANTFKPAVYYPHLVQLMKGTRLRDNPNQVTANLFVNKSALKDHLDDYWFSFQAKDVANYVFDNQGAAKAYVYTFYWESNPVWDKYYDNYGSYRESPETEKIVVGVTSDNKVTCVVCHAHYLVQKYPDPPVTGGTHPIIYFRGGHHGPYTSPGIGNSFLYWGYNYTLGKYYPAVIEQ